MKIEGGFSSQTAIKHVVVVVGLATVMGFAMATKGLFPDPEKADAANVKNVLWLAVATWVASYAAQKGKSILLFFSGLVVLVFGLAAPVMTALAAKAAQSQVITKAERADFEMIGGRLCHPALQFSLRALPRAYQADLRKAKLMNKEAKKNMANWAFSAPSGEVVMVQVIKGMSSSSRTFTQFVTGLRETSVRSLSSKMTSEQVDADLTPYRYELSLERQDGTALDFVCTSPDEPGTTGLVVCVTTFAGTPSQLKGVRESVRHGSCV